MKNIKIIVTFLGLLFFTAACGATGPGFDGKLNPVADENNQAPQDNSEGPQVHLAALPRGPLDRLKPASSPFQSGGLIAGTRNHPATKTVASAPHGPSRTSINSQPTIYTVNKGPALRAAVSQLEAQVLLQQLHHQYATYLHDLDQHPAGTIDEYSQKMDEIWQQEVGIDPSNIAITRGGFEKFFNFIRMANDLRGHASGFQVSPFQLLIDGLGQSTRTAQNFLNQALSAQDATSFIANINSASVDLNEIQTRSNGLRNEIYQASRIYGVSLQDVDGSFLASTFNSNFSSELISKLNLQNQTLNSSNGASVNTIKAQSEKILEITTFNKGDGQNPSYIAFFNFKEGNYEAVEDMVSFLPN